MLNELYHSLNPVAFSAGPITIYWYGIAIDIRIVGAILTGHRHVPHAAPLGLRHLRRRHHDRGHRRGPSACSSVRACSTLCSMVTVITSSTRSRILATNHGGMSFHGGLVGGILGGVIACRVCKLFRLTIADLAVIGVPLALCLGRCANFVNGDVWGKPTDLPGASSLRAGGDVARHPSQLYEALLEGILLSS